MFAWWGWSIVVERSARGDDSVRFSNANAFRSQISETIRKGLYCGGVLNRIKS